MDESIKDYMGSSSNLIMKSLKLADKISNVIWMMRQGINHGNKIIVFGNGGSAADSQHFAAELIGRFKLERKSLNSISLTTDTSVLTSIGNDYGFKFVFSRQCEALVSKGDVVLAISTSGNSANVIEGVKVSKARGAKIISLTGGNGGKLKTISDLSIVVPSRDTAKIQEVHRIILHIISQETEKYFKSK
jgi:D-sedoheptulose 7-phosphate isomerase